MWTRKDIIIYNKVNAIINSTIVVDKTAPNPKPNSKR